MHTSELIVKLQNGSSVKFKMELCINSYSRIEEIWRVNVETKDKGKRRWIPLRESCSDVNTSAIRLMEEADLSCGFNIIERLKQDIIDIIKNKPYIITYY